MGQQHSQFLTAERLHMHREQAEALAAQVRASYCLKRTTP
jgi:hypothetical protein